MSPRSSVLLAALLSGCSLFKLDVDAPATRRASEEAQVSEAMASRVHVEQQARLAAQRDAEAAAARDQALIAQIDAQRAEIHAGCVDPATCTRDLGPNGAKATRFAALVAGARDSAAVRDGRLDLPALQREAVGYLEQAPPSYEVFIAMAAIASTPETDAAVARACPRTRPVVPAEAVADFVALCVARAGGDATQLAWPGIKTDMVALREADEARAQAEAEDARVQAEAERAALAAERAAAQTVQSSAARAIAAVFAGGRCNFGNCLKDGWTAAVDGGEVRVACNFGDCLKNGWTARLPDGSEARTSCNFGDCMKNGWDTRYSDGTSARTTCNFGECPKHGWQTTLPDGGSARTTCNFGDCFKDGWSTQMPGGSVRCSCNFQKCLSNGTSCQ